MATVQFDVLTDMRTFGSYNNSNKQTGGGGGNLNSTTYEWTWNSGFHEIISGTGFDTTNFTTYPDDGTVTGWQLDFSERLFNPADPFTPIVVNHSFWTFSGLSVPGADFSNAISNDGATLAAYMPTMLAGNDTVNGSEFNDYLLGFAGADSLFGNAGNDGLEGGAGGDLLDGGDGADTMRGGIGSDTYIVDSVNDKAIEDADAGNDLVKSSVSFTLGHDVERLTLTGSSAIDGTGNTLANTVTGNSAANILRGAGGNDTIRGVGGNDTIAGGLGNDSLDGGSGSDTFLFDSALNGTKNVDDILNFSVADDTISLDDDVFTLAGAPGTLDADAFHIGATAQDAEDRIIYDSTNGNIYYDADGDGAGAAVLFAHVAAGTVLTNADFLIVA
jgi:serralysin